MIVFLYLMCSLTLAAAIVLAGVQFVTLPLTSGPAAMVTPLSTVFLGFCLAAALGGLGRLIATTKAQTAVLREIRNYMPGAPSIAPPPPREDPPVFQVAGAAVPQTEAEAAAAAAANTHLDPKLKAFLRD